MSDKVRNIIIVVMVVTITSAIIGVSYGIMSELGFNTNNTISYDQTLKITFQGESELDIKKEEQHVLFSVVNYGTLDMLYDVVITPTGLDNKEMSLITVVIDDKSYQMSDLPKKGDNYILYTGAIKKEKSSNDALSHKITIYGTAHGSVKITVDSMAVNDLASDIVTGLNYKDNKFGLTEDSMGNVRYTGSNPYNYIEFNNELWRIIGVFNVSDSFDNMEASRVKIVRDESLNELTWSNNANLFSNAAISKFLNESYYETIENKTLFNAVVYKIGEYSSITSKEQALRLEMNGLDNSSAVTLPSVADYLYAKEWLKTGWLLASNENNTEMFYSVLDSGEVGLKKYNERALVSPVVYLNSTIRIIDGDGSKTNPFVIQ